MDLNNLLARHRTSLMPADHASSRLTQARTCWPPSGSPVDSWTAADMGEESRPPARKPQFRRQYSAVKPDPALVGRQMEATRLAFQLFGSVEAARTFLNDADAELGGRPLDIAGSSPEGLQRVVVYARRMSGTGE